MTLKIRCEHCGKIMKFKTSSWKPDAYVVWHYALVGAISEERNNKIKYHAYLDNLMGKHCPHCNGVITFTNADRFLRLLYKV